MLAHWKSGEPETAARLMALVYDELRLLARAYLQRERPGHLMQATGLVHEAYLRLVDQTTPAAWQNRGHFFGAAARVMRRILVDHARADRAAKRASAEDRLGWEEAVAAVVTRGVDLIALDDALGDLAELAPQQSEIVDLRFFGGLTVEEVAEALELSPRTVKREWRIAKAWLRREIFRENEDASAA